jgi:hypothetical protein
MEKGSHGRTGKARQAGDGKGAGQGRAFYALRMGPCSLMPLRAARQALFLDGEVPEEPFEALLIGVVILPCSEVTDVALVAELACPWLLRVHHSVIDTDWEKDKLASSVSFLRGSLAHLIFDPFAGDGVFGENEQDLVSKFDRLIDCIPGLGTDRQIMRSKPAPDPFVLQVCMQALGEVLVLARIADEATVSLDGLVQQRWQVFD